MDIKEKQKLYVLFGIFGVALLMFYFNLLLAPQFRGFIAKNRGFFAVKRSVRAAERLIANKEGIKRQYEELENQAEYLEKSLPAQDEVSSLLGDFSDIAESSGVKILKIKPIEMRDDELGEAGIYREFPILIEARAGYHQCGAFINKLENMERFISIDDISISGRPQDPLHHDIKLRVRTYVAKE
ncbi:MAG: type 4a pilus biogenesis protein PilO [Candidatus Omnitrophica bacterium]|nr:type 4a pilus biogenesis protein PilO [Candidatus Omnitrophota bacterium]MBU4457768.1 type 4a pilus biogenesis protein PilO [Candidatus Omnitrophota bacterium]